ncbi:MAG TPA: DUF2085 domain-containing protein [Methanoculleus thermophilus]|nr:DUF2085 domain-containing protein [Bacillota bacterium]HQD25875.1 DUF2085 domain-containing protein [Methanoculleus thermophilus]
MKYAWDSQIGPTLQISIFGRTMLLCLCHRKKERTTNFFGFENILCARCQGILFGMLSGVLCWMYSLSFIPTIAAVLFMIPMLVDGFTQNFNKRESTNTLRIITGFLFGYGFAIFFLTTFTT